MAHDAFRIIMETQAQYARTIDSDRLEDWPTYFADPCHYLITTASSHADGLQAGLIFANSVGMLKDRVSALREANIYERHNYRHILNAPVIVADRGSEVESETAFMVARIMRTGDTDLFATGRYVDRYHIVGNTARIMSRIVVLDSTRIDTLLAIPL